MYALKEDSFSFIKELPSPSELAQENDKLSYKIACLEDASILCCSHIGPKAVMMVQQAGIFVLKSEKESESINTFLQTLLELKTNRPPLWMQRLLHVKTT